MSSSISIISCITIIFIIITIAGGPASRLGGYIKLLRCLSLSLSIYIYIHTCNNNSNDNNNNNNNMCEQGVRLHVPVADAPGVERGDSGQGLPRQV